MTAFKFLGGGFVLLLIGVLVGGFFLPPVVEVRRVTTLNAQPESVYRFLSDLRNFPRWSPWHVMDPATEYSFNGSERQVGMRMDWVSEHPKVGEGSQEIRALLPDQRIDLDLYFNGHPGGSAHYFLRPRPDGTELTWGYRQDFGFNVYGRYIGLLIDDMLGPLYEDGLQRLKSQIENTPNS